MSKHTAGPWHIVNYPSGMFEILGDDTYPIFRIRGGMTPTTPNARLIAAAPDLLAALEKLNTRLAGGLQNSWAKSLQDIIVPAIAKAQS